VAVGLGTSLQYGLDDAEATLRLAVNGPNTLREGRRRGPARILLAQFTDFMVIVLLAAAVVAGAIGEPQDTIAIIAIVILNAVLGFVQESRAERALAALKAMVAPQARTRRAGAVRTIAGTELVPGDLVLLEAGNVVPADVRLSEVAQLRIEEAALTGESQPVDKITDALPHPALPLGDRRNMAYKGTIVTYGRAVGVVVATGMHTELGRIAALLREEEEVRTPLQRRLARFAQRLALGVLAICAVIFGIGLLRGEEPVLMFLTALSLAVAAIPEALPAVVTVSLALGARRMAARNALIRRLPAVETLGSVTFICSDKTGTLTANRMRVRVIRTADALSRGAQPPDAVGNAPPRMLVALALSNDAERTPDGSVSGDPTEAALFQSAADGGYEKATLELTMPRLTEIPFSSERGMMTTLHRDGGRVIAFTKGAPERVLRQCAHGVGPSGKESLDEPAMSAEAEAMAANGLRVLAVASRSFAELPDDLSPEAIERDLTFLGLVGLFDPPRPEAAAAIEECKTAGIHVVMITGDHAATATAIARQLGIVGDDDRHVVTGPSLARLSGEALGDIVETTRVYARVAPEQKLTIVRALQERGQFVAVTGDGVNDAPALQRADIGVAMGRSGTDVAREAAHMVLLDDNFATIVTAIREGRQIYDNIRKFVRYALTCNSAEIWTLFLAPLLGLPVPLLPIHILWINLVTDGLPGVVLALEPAEHGLMRRPPRPPTESIFAHGLWQHALWIGLLMGAVALFTQAWAYHSGSVHWQSMTFTVLALLQLGHLLAIRSERDPFHRRFFSNLSLLAVVIFTVGLQLATLYVRPLNPVFKTEPLSAGELAFCFALSTAGFVAVEVEKLLVRRGVLYGDDRAPASAKPGRSKS
jgi:P-type Ca2+ transporter type 2C